MILVITRLKTAGVALQHFTEKQNLTVEIKIISVHLKICL